MDPKIQAYRFERRNGLCFCWADGVAYQPDMARSVEYDRPYFEKYVMYESTPTGQYLNEQRVKAVAAWARRLPIIDIGVGCGTFLKYCLAEDLDAYGFDINPVAIHWLRKLNLQADPYSDPAKFLCWTFWDSLEHIPEPQILLEKIPLGAFVFVSMPIFRSLGDITASKHYRPDEHYYYFTPAGLLRWMREYRLQLRRIYNFEEVAGREGIKTFLFERVAAVKKISGRDMLAELFGQVEQTTEACRDAINGGKP